MAVKLDLKLGKDAIQPDAYLMVSDSYIHHFDDYVEVFVSIYDSEDARRQQVEDSESHRLTPLKRIRVEIPKAIYDERVKDAAQALAAAIYGVLTDYAEPHGLKEMIKTGEVV